MEGKQYEGEITGKIVEAVEQGHLSLESLATTIEYQSDLTNDEQVSIKETLSILQSQQ